MHSPSDKSRIWRRRLGYPILTLIVAGAVYFYSQGRIAETAPAQASDYERAAREVMYAARAGRALPGAVNEQVVRFFGMFASDALRSSDGGELSFEVGGPAAPDGSSPFIRTVIVRAPHGDRVGLSISILGGKTDLVGVSRIDAQPPADAPVAAGEPR
ncbi:MAG: hypothetical protein ACKOYN_00475 [Planctomycetota bacterium]